MAVGEVIEAGQFGMFRIGSGKKSMVGRDRSKEANGRRGETGREAEKSGRWCPLEKAAGFEVEG